MGGKHKVLTYKCPRCPRSFNRQRRRVHTEKPLCRGCKAQLVDKWKFRSTEWLKFTINNDGVTFIGTDLEQYLDELKAVLWEREQTKIEKQINEYNKQSIESEIIPF